jgi:3'(2'), 5'-bisphosphate nucleotidase
MDDDYAQELDLAARLAREAGVLAMRHRAAGVTVERKAEDEPVTIADREASALILAGLAAAFPDDVRISEEADDDRRRLDAGRRTWFVDPIDGTRDFIKGRAGFAVMIGLCVAGRPVLGAVYQPDGDRLFLGLPGVGLASCDDGQGPRRIACTRTKDVTQLRLVASASHRTGKIDEVKVALGIADELNIGSVGLKLSLIATGTRDLYVNPSSRSKAWDTCAPEAIIRAAGGTVTDLYGEPLSYLDPDMHNRRGLLASNGAAHASVLAKLAPLFPR